MKNTYNIKIIDSKAENVSLSFCIQATQKRDILQNQALVMAFDRQYNNFPIRKFTYETLLNLFGGEARSKIEIVYRKKN